MRKSRHNKAIIFLLFMILCVGMAHTCYALTNTADIPYGYEGTDAPDLVWWNNNLACWTKPDGAAAYQVILFRGGNEVNSVRLTNNRHNFRSDMTEAGNYTFRVRAIDSYGIYGQLSDSSDIRYVSGYASSSRSGVSGSGSEASGANPGSGLTSSRNSFGPTAAQPGWQRDKKNGNWWYRNLNGSYPANQWQQIDDTWYYFDNSGYMVTGWLMLDDATYYCLSDGSMATGWQNINGYSFYFDPVTGELWVSNATPDGHIF